MTAFFSGSGSFELIDLADAEYKNLFLLRMEAFAFSWLLIMSSV